MQKVIDETYVLAKLILGPAPADGVFHFQLDCHALFAGRLCVVRVFVLLLRADIGVGMKGLGVDFDEVWHPDHPILRRRA